ncbi:MAG: hypothetical protein LBR79_04230 [Oscillospiraceae bacterium]|jgi:hypothetical protein|nr:hypothetical protein [Oscillospiraceae bacterium]
MGHNEELIKALIELVEVTEEKLKEEAELEKTQSKAKSVETNAAEDKPKVAKRAKKDNSEITQTIKDDLETLKAKHQKINFDIMSIINKIKSKKVANYDHEFVEAAEKITAFSINEFYDKKIGQCVERFKIFFKIASLKLGNGDPMSKLTIQLFNILNNLKEINFEKPGMFCGIKKKVKTIMKEMHMLTRKEQQNV